MSKKKVNYAIQTLRSCFCTPNLIKACLLSMVLFAGAFLRFNHVTEFQNFWGDQTRDILVAQHIVEEEHPPIVSSAAIGGLGVLYNVPFYYYILAATYLVVQRGEYIVLLFALSGSLTVVIGYMVGKEISGFKFGLCVATLLAFSLQLISVSRTIWQPHLIPLITVTAFYVLIKAKKQHSPLPLTLYLFCLFFINVVGTLIHYSFLPVFILFSLLSVFILWQKGSSQFKRLIVISLMIIGLFSIFIVSTKVSYFSPLFSFNLAKNVQHIQQILNIILGEQLATHFGENIALVNFFILFSLLVWQCVKKIRQKKDPFLPLSFLMILTTPLLLAFYSADILSHYFLCYIVLVPILISYCFWSIKKPLLIQVAFAVLLMLPLLLHWQVDARGFYAPNVLAESQFKYQEYVASRILEDYVKREGKTAPLSLGLLDSYNSPTDPTLFSGELYIGTPTVWFFLERFLHQHLVKLTNDPGVYTNIYPNVSQPKYYYFTCRSLDGGGDYMNEQEMMQRAETYCLPMISTFLQKSAEFTVIGQEAVKTEQNFGSIVFFVLKKNE